MNFLSPSKSYPASRLITLPQIRDARGSLCVAECEKHVPFVVRRCFWVFGVPAGQERGGHSHKICHQFLICVHGACKTSADNGQVREEFLLNQPDVGLYIPPLVWDTQVDFSADAVLLVLASHAYNSDDYIRDYQQFLAQI